MPFTTSAALTAKPSRRSTIHTTSSRLAMIS